MARPQSSPILAQLRSAKTYPEQTAALQALKNEIVGHIQKKEAWIGFGVLEPIVLTLSASRSPAKPNGKDARTQLVSRPLSDEDSVKLQALQLVASFANGKHPPRSHRLNWLTQDFRRTGFPRPCPCRRRGARHPGQHVPSLEPATARRRRPQSVDRHCRCRRPGAAVVASRHVFPRR